jgi:hypothetical protein
LQSNPPIARFGKDSFRTRRKAVQVAFIGHRPADFAAARPAPRIGRFIQGGKSMKSVLFVTAIMFAGAAAAQTTEDKTTTTTTTATSQVSQPSNAGPELDARGIPVISDPAAVPAGFNNPPGMGGPADASSPPAPQPATENYPACSRTVTDNCVQTYERGRSPR